MLDLIEEAFVATGAGETPVRDAEASLAFLGDQGMVEVAGDTITVPGQLLEQRATSRRACISGLAFFRLEAQEALRPCDGIYAQPAVTVPGSSRCAGESYRHVN